jgi:ADP-heptose:LPS heptosyltransferase
MFEGVNFVKSGSFWTEDVPKKSYKPVSFMAMRDMGLPKNNISIVNTLEELKQTPPNIVTAEALRDTRFVQNWFKHQVLYKKTKYVMGLGVYQQLHYDMPRHISILKPTRPLFKSLYTPYEGEPVDDCSLLVFRTGGIGDLLFIQPNLIYLKEKYPTCKIKFACGPQYQSMVETWECVDEVLDLPFRLRELEEADYHMMFEGVIERCKESHTTNAYRLFSKWLGLNLPDDKLIPSQKAKPERVEECRKIINEWKLEEKSFIVMQLRASSPVRTPSNVFWKYLIDELTDKGYNILLTDNPRQSENVDKFIAQSKTPTKVFNFCQHSKTLDYTIAAVSLSLGTVATDSSLNHIAASLNLPCFGIYGPFPGEIRLATYPKAEWVDAVKECAPCFLHGSRPCPKAGADGFSPCYNNINIPEVVEKVERLFGK